MKRRKRVRKHNKKVSKKVIFDFKSLKRILVYGVGGGCLIGLMILAGDYLRHNPPHLFDVREIIVSAFLVSEMFFTIIFPES